MNGQENVVQRSRRRLTNLAKQPAGSSWYRVVRNSAGGPTRVDIYDEIGGGGWAGGVTAVDFVAELAAIPGDLRVHINSPGGDVFDGLAIYNSLAQRPGNVTTVVDGIAASAASFIAQAGTTRVVAPGSMMMIHDASGMCMGNAADMRELAELLDKVSDNLAGIYAQHSGRPDGWREAMRAETWYTADEAVAAGLADKVAERPHEAALAVAARFDLSAYANTPAGFVRNVAHQFDMGDRVRCSGAAHDPQHTGRTGTVMRINGNAYGILFDGLEAEGVHCWYVDNELVLVAEENMGPGMPPPSPAARNGHAVRNGDDGYMPQPYERDDGETVECPECHKYNAPDASYCDQCGEKLAGNDDVVVRSPASGGKKTAAKKKKHLKNADGVDESPWDAAKAWHGGATADDPAAFYKAICAGRKEGDPAKQSSWALPYRYTPSSPPNRAGVRNALSRLPQTDGLTNREAAQKLLEGLMKKINPEYEPASDHTDTPSWLTDDTTPLPAWL